MTKTIAISDARAGLPELVTEINDKLSRAIITVNGKPKVVLMSIEELEGLEETNEILAIPGALQSIREGRKQIKNGEFVRLEDLE